MNELFMIRTSLSARHLYQLAKKQQHQVADLGYATHCMFASLFGEQAKPFAIVTEHERGRVPGRQVSVVAYTTTAPDTLKQHALEFSDPQHHGACDWASFAGKPMPTTFDVGRKLGFEVRVMPTIRKSSDGAFHKKGAEVDAFVSACWDAADAAGLPAGASVAERAEVAPVDRAAVYRDWLASRLEGAADLVSAELQRFALTPSFRRGKSRGERRATKRPGRTQWRPDATLRGTLTVQDPDAFDALLRRGVGRHRSFGFGMLLLRPPGS